MDEVRFTRKPWIDRVIGCLGVSSGNAEDAVRAVLFDLDGTLLDVDIDAFLGRYFVALGPVVADLLGDGMDASRAIEIVHQATRAMMQPHPAETNQCAFDRRFVELTGADLERSYEVFMDFYSTVFPTLGVGIGPAVGGVEAVQTALDVGMRVAIATNPIFPEVAIRQRMSWAGVGDLDIHVVTTFEKMHACKPMAAYFLETADLLGVAPSDCLMVGDDPTLDMPAARVGMSTFYVGFGADDSASYSGSLRDVSELLRQT